MDLNSVILREHAFSANMKPTSNPVEDKMAQQNLGLTIVISLFCGLVGGIIGGFLAPLIAAGVIVGAVSAASDSVPDEVGKAQRTMADMRSIGTACEAYAVDNRRYPDADSVVRLSVRVEPTYILKMPYEDGWGNRFEIASGGRTYEIRSKGADGIPNNMDDIVYSNAEFTQIP